MCVVWSGRPARFSPVRRIIAPPIPSAVTLLEFPLRRFPISVIPSGAGSFGRTVLRSRGTPCPPAVTTGPNGSSLQEFPATTANMQAQAGFFDAAQDDNAELLI
jgi:hypothetical protein